MAEPEVVKFAFQVRQGKTMADKTFNITLNLPEYEADAAFEIMRRVDAAGEGALVFEPISLAKLDNETEKETEKRITRVGRRRS